MVVHDLHAIKRTIQFIESLTVEKHIHASEQCCWNCLWSMMTYECLWCEREMGMVDFRDLCMAWKGNNAARDV